MKIIHSVFSTILLCFCLLWGAVGAFAQGTNLGTIRGTVTDVNGALVSGAKVQVTAQGFKSAVVNEVALRGGDIVRADAQLQVGGANETIEVSTSANVINLETPTVGGTLNTQQILDLPRDNRDIFSFLYLNPNITQADSDGTFKFIGAQSYGASFTLDGQQSNGSIFGEHTLSQPSLEAIGELTVLSNNFSAEYAGVANIRVTTRRGGQDYHGSAFYNNK